VAGWKQVAGEQGGEKGVELQVQCKERVWKEEVNKSMGGSGGKAVEE